MEKNEERNGLHARTQADSEILTFETEVPPYPNDGKTAEKRWKIGKSTHFPNKKQPLSERKAAFFSEKTCFPMTGNLLSDHRKHTSCRQKAHLPTPPKPVFHRFPPPVSLFRKKSPPAKSAYRHPSVNGIRKTDDRTTTTRPTFHSRETPSRHTPIRPYIYKVKEWNPPPPTAHPDHSDKFLLTINNPNTGLRMKKKEKLNLHGIPTYETISYFCSAFGKQMHTGY